MLDFVPATPHSPTLPSAEAPDRRPASGRVASAGGQGIRGRRSERLLGRFLVPFALACVLGLVTARPGAAQSGTFTVRATVSSSIRLVFVDAAGASETTVGSCPVTNSGASQIGVDFGTCSRQGGCTRTCVRFTRLGGNVYTAESAFDLVVTKANATSNTYNVQVWMGTAPPAGATYSINGTVLSTAAQALAAQATNDYDLRIPQNLMLRIVNNMPGGVVDRTIHYLATSN